jgi:hypothetical protein
MAESPRPALLLPAKLSAPSSATSHLTECLRFTLGQLLKRAAYSCPKRRCCRQNLSFRRIAMTAMIDMKLTFSDAFAAFATIISLSAILYVLHMVLAFF